MAVVLREGFFVYDQESTRGLETSFGQDAYAHKRHERFVVLDQSISSLVNLRWRDVSALPRRDLIIKRTSERRRGPQAGIHRCDEETASLV